MKNILVLYHGGNCLDGFGAAYVAWKKFGDEAEYLPVNYGETPPNAVGKQVYILDFSFPRNVLEDMHVKADSLLVLDHHKTAQEALQGLDYAQFDMNRSGCMLAWDYFFPRRDPPRGLIYIQDRDLWCFKHRETKAFCAALFGLVPFEFKAWDKAIKTTSKLTTSGEAILQVFEKDIENLLERRCECTLKGKNGLAVNAISKYASELGNRLAQLSGTYGLVYSINGKTCLWEYSLRSVGDYDVSEIAKAFGGGGHKNAAGFTAKIGEHCA